jgi:hypothetical protein
MVLLCGAARASAQTYEACYVPSVGAVYLIKQAGLPGACLASAHVPFTWTLAPTLADGSVTTAKLADNAATSAKIADGAVTEAKLGFDPATQTELNAVAGRISGWEILTGQVTIQPSQRGFVLLQCPAGKAAVGGGFEAQRMTVEQSQPGYGNGASQSTWAVSWFNPLPTAETANAYVVCVSTS